LEKLVGALPLVPCDVYFNGVNICLFKKNKNKISLENEKKERNEMPKKKKKLIFILPRNQ
jgi:hypothetical protein